MVEKKDNQTKIIRVLILVIIVLLVLLAYAFILKPVINGMVVKSYNQGATDVIVEISSRAEGCQSVPLVVGERTINVVDINCITPEINV